MKSASNEAWKNGLMGETLVFQLLGKLLYAEVDRLWLESLIRDDVFSEAPFGEDQPEVEKGIEILSHWCAVNREGLSEEELDQLKGEQLRLFIGTPTPQAPVWESIYFSDARLMFQKETLDVRQWYARFGLQIEKLGNEPDDHIGLELSFTAHLAATALAALERGDHNLYQQALQAQRDFLSEHLLRWCGSWAKLVQQHARTDFYRGLAYLTHGALLAAAEMLEVPLPAEEAA